MSGLVKVVGAALLLCGLALPALGQGVFPVTVEHALGSTTVSAEPLRVVSLSQRDTDTLLALGIKPVAVNSTLGFETGVGVWSEALLGDSKPTVWNWEDLDYEAIVAAQPDLIVYTNSGGDAEEFARLSQIAPTIPLPAGAKPWDATLDEVTLLTAAALGRKADGEALLAALEQHIVDLRDAHPEFAGRTINYLNSYQADTYGYDTTLATHQTLYKLGFAPAASALDLPGGESWAQISPELLSQFDADVLVLFTYGETLEQVIAGLPTLASLASVKGGRAFVLGDEALNVNSVVSLPYALDNLAPQISAALAK